MLTTSRGGREAVLRLAAEDPQWIPAVRAALRLAQRSTGEFAGAWILAELQRQGASRTWYPNFRRLVTFDILEKAGDSTRRGQRTYYRIRDIEGVQSGLAEYESRGTPRRPATKLSFTALGRSGRADLSNAEEEILRSDFPAR